MIYLYFRNPGTCRPVGVFTQGRDNLPEGVKNLEEKHFSYENFLNCKQVVH